LRLMPYHLDYVAWHRVQGKERKLKRYSMDEMYARGSVTTPNPQYQTT